MPYVGGNKYNLIGFDMVKTKFIHGQEVHMNYFKEPYIPLLREELHVEENTFLEEYVEVKEENIEIFEEINEGLVIEEELEIKIVEEINEDPIIEKDLRSR